MSTIKLSMQVHDTEKEDNPNQIPHSPPVRVYQICILESSGGLFCFVLFSIDVSKNRIVP